MSWLEFTAPDTGKSYRIELFGSGGGILVAEALSERLGYEVPLLAQVPFDEALLQGGDRGEPLVLGAPEHPAAQALLKLGEELANRSRNLVGKMLPVSPA